MSDNKEAEQLTFDLSTTTTDGITISVPNNDLWNGGSTSTITFDTDYLTDTGSEYTFNTTFEEFEDTMPSISKIKGMCEQYPAFKKEFEKFRQMYNLIKDDYEANNEDDIPF